MIELTNKALGRPENFISSRVERDRIKAEKESKIIFFLSDEGFSTSSLIAKLLDVTQTTAYRTLKKMELKELVKMDETGFSLGRSGKQVIWGLTPTGALLATDPDAETFKIDFYEVGRVKPVTIEHSLELQAVRIVAMKNHWTNWRSSRKVQRMANADRNRWLQVPDALALSPKGYETAFELERTIKTSKRYEAILSNYSMMLKNGTIKKVIYICPQDRVRGVERLFRSIEKIKIEGKVVPTPEGLLNRFEFLAYDQLESLA